MVSIKKSTIFDFISSLVLNYKYSDMNIITADFNWISLLLIIGGAIFSIIKSYNKKNEEKSLLQNTDTDIEIENESVYDEVERYATAKKADPIPVVSIEAEESIESDSISGEEEFQLDIRQAIIGSEILRRPEY